MATRKLMVADDRLQGIVRWLEGAINAIDKASQVGGMEHVGYVLSAQRMAAHAAKELTERCERMTLLPVDLEATR